MFSNRALHSGKEKIKALRKQAKPLGIGAPDDNKLVPQLVGV